MPRACVFIFFLLSLPVFYVRPFVLSVREYPAMLEKKRHMLTTIVYGEKVWNVCTLKAYSFFYFKVREIKNTRDDKPANRFEFTGDKKNPEKQHKKVSPALVIN